MPLNIDRRRLMAGALGTGAIAALPWQAALALTENTAVGLIETAVGDVHRIINSGKSEAAMLEDFESIFRTYADVARIAGLSMGAPWRGATDRQKAAYVQAFQGYISRKYGRQFRKFIGAEIDVVRSTDGGRKGVLVLTMMTLSGQTPFEVEWQVIDAGGQAKIFDLIIEGISMLATERSEIGAMLEQLGGDIDKLVSRLQQT